MPVAIRTTDFPEGVGTKMYDGVRAEMDIENDPPAGLIFHWAGEVDGKWTVTNLWESRDAYDRFRGERLFPGNPRGVRHGSGQRATADRQRVRGSRLRQAVTHGRPVRARGCGSRSARRRSVTPDNHPSSPAGDSGLGPRETPSTPRVR